MKIKLLVDLPIDKREGAIKGRNFETTKITGSGARAKYFFIGDTGCECAAFDYEVEIVPEGWE